MDANGAVKAVSALAHLHRLTVFRMLVREGLSGLPAGEIAARLEIAPSALSFHLANLERAGLVQSWRSGRIVSSLPHNAPKCSVITKPPSPNIQTTYASTVRMRLFIMN